MQDYENLIQDYENGSIKDLIALYLGRGRWNAILGEKNDD